MFLLSSMAICTIGQAAASDDTHRVSIDVGDIAIEARLYPAPADEPAPAVIILHGWNWAHIDPAVDLDTVARQFQRAGYTSLLPSMRGWPPSGGVDDCAGKQVDDALAMVEWLRSRPDVASDRLFITGYSQGGQIALLAAARGASLRALAVFAPVVDPATWGKETRIDGIRDYVMQECGGPQGWPSRSALEQAASIRQPLLLVHGDADRRVPASQSRELYDALQAMKRPVRYILLEGVDHAMQNVLQPALAIDFFTR